MSSLALSGLAAQTQRAAQTQSSRGVNQFRRRWLHNTLKRQGIMMPALSPFMTEGTVTSWKLKEGDSFVAGDVLLQIENDVAVVDVEASCAGILGKILTPGGTTHVPVEAMIALVAKDLSELASIQTQSLAPTPPPYTPTPGPPSATLSPRHPEYKLPMMSPRTPIMTMSPRTPSLFEMQAMGHGHRSAHIGGPRGTFKKPSLTLDTPPRSPRISQEAGNDTPVSSRPLMSAADIAYPTTGGLEESQTLDGAAIRRMIVANLSAAQPAEYEDFA